MRFLFIILFSLACAAAITHIPKRGWNGWERALIVALRLMDVGGFG